MSKSYTYETITYGYSKSAKKWQFGAGSYTLIQDCGGKENADKVARQIQGALNRGGKMDNLARYTIDQLVG